MKPYLKPVLAFLSLLATNVATQVAINDAPFPTSWQDGIRWAVTTLAGTWLVYRVPNETTDPAVAARQSVRLKVAVPE